MKFTIKDKSGRGFFGIVNEHHVKETEGTNDDGQTVEEWLEEPIEKGDTWENESILITLVDDSVEIKVWARVGVSMILTAKPGESMEKLFTEKLNQMNPGKLDFHFDGESYIPDESDEMGGISVHI